jgi:hypothetical protein
MDDHQVAYARRRLLDAWRSGTYAQRSPRAPIVVDDDCHATCAIGVAVAVGALHALQRDEPALAIELNQRHTFDEIADMFEARWGPEPLSTTMTVYSFKPEPIKWTDWSRVVDWRGVVLMVMLVAWVAA